MKTDGSDLMRFTWDVALTTMRGSSCPRRDVVGQWTRSLPERVLLRALAAEIDGMRLRHSLVDFNLVANAPLGGYCVDFLLTMRSPVPDAPKRVRRVALEVDSVRWHDRSEAQMAYERERGNWLMGELDAVLRVTAGQVFDNPFQAANALSRHVERMLDGDAEYILYEAWAINAPGIDLATCATWEELVAALRRGL